MIVAAEHPAQKIVRDSANVLLDLIRKDLDTIKSDPAYLQVELDKFVVPNIDFETMTKLSLGKYWLNANEDQKLELVAQFKKFLLRIYTKAFAEYKGGEIVFEDYQPSSRTDRAIVRSRFIQPGSADVPVIYKLREKNGWKIYDIEVNRLSLVTNYRSSFASEINKNGIDGLIKLLKNRSKQSI